MSWRSARTTDGKTTDHAAPLIGYTTYNMERKTTTAASSMPREFEGSAEKEASGMTLAES
jgi:hypothetical protein